MEEYRRQIAYLYTYPDHNERQSLGFVKLELRKHQCRLEVHLKKVQSLRGKAGKIYIYFQRQDQMVGIYLGELEEQAQAMGWQGMIDALNIQGKGISLSDTKGIWLTLSEDQDCVAEWEDAWIGARKLLIYPRGGEKCIRCAWFGNCERSTQDVSDRGREVYERSHPAGQKSMEASGSAYRMRYRKRR